MRRLKSTAVYGWFTGLLIGSSHSSELVFAKVFLEDIRIHQLGWLKAHMAMKIIPALKANPGKKVSVNNSGIHIREIDIV